TICEPCEFRIGDLQRFAGDSWLVWMPGSRRIQKMLGNIELRWKVRRQKWIRGSRGHIHFAAAALLGRRRCSGNADFVPGRSSGVECVVNLRILLPAGFDGYRNGALIHEEDRKSTRL